MTLSAADVAGALLAKGMEPSDSHHKMYRRTIEGVTTLVTRMSQWGRNDQQEKRRALMASQCALRLKEFEHLIECTLSAEEWEALIRERCSDGRNPFMRR